MENVKVKDILKAVNGRLLTGSEESDITGISTNSKELESTELFVPIIGERVDAHCFIEEALKCCAAAFTQEHDSATPGMIASGKAVIAVTDTLKAMQSLAKWYRMRFFLPIVGVTGSVGKTTTREMVSAALSSGKKVFQTEKNYNSQVGVPLTLSKLSAKDEIAVLEMGMSNPGEMLRLADMIRPDAAVITCIGVAHIEQLKTQDNICSEKMKIASYMTKEMPVFLNGDDAYLVKYADCLKGKPIYYGFGEHCDYRAVQVEVTNGITHFTMQYPNGTLSVELSAMGEHNIRNALAALAVCDFYQVNLKTAASALYDFKGQRQKVIETDSFTIIDDTYNASPDSMKAALKVLRDYPCRGKRIAVLADMLELGEKTKEYHRQVGECVKECNIDLLIGYGELASEIEKAASIGAVHAESIDTIISYLKENATPEDVVLFKGSNGMKLSKAVEYFV